MSDKKEQQTKTYQFPENVSLKEKGNFIDGKYLGCTLKKSQGIKGNDLIIAYFDNNDKLLSCVAGTQIQNFLKNFERGYYLKITRDVTLKTKSGNDFATYKFEYDPAGLKNEQIFVLADMTEIGQTDKDSDLPF